MCTVLITIIVCYETESCLAMVCGYISAPEARLGLKLLFRVCEVPCYPFYVICGPAVFLLW